MPSYFQTKCNRLHYVLQAIALTSARLWLTEDHAGSNNPDDTKAVNR